MSAAPRCRSWPGARPVPVRGRGLELRGLVRHGPHHGAQKSTAPKLAAHDVRVEGGIVEFHGGPDEQRPVALPARGRLAEARMRHRLRAWQCGQAMIRASFDMSIRPLWRRTRHMRGRRRVDHPHIHRQAFAHALVTMQNCSNCCRTRSKCSRSDSLVLQQDPHFGARDPPASFRIALLACGDLRADWPRLFLNCATRTPG